MKKEKTAIDLIFENFNLLSNANFISWMLNNYNELKQIERKQILDAYYQGADDESNEHGEMYLDLTDAERYYNSNYEV